MMGSSTNENTDIDLNGNSSIEQVNNPDQLIRSSINEDVQIELNGNIPIEEIDGSDAMVEWSISEDAQIDVPIEQCESYDKMVKWSSEDDQINLNGNFQIEQVNDSDKMLAWSTNEDAQIDMNGNLTVEQINNSRRLSKGASESTNNGYSISDSECCRICSFGGGELISPCSCTGSVGKVHSSCLQRWVQTRNIDKCEVCTTPFSVIRTPKHFAEWFKSSENEERRYLIKDFIVISVLVAMEMLSGILFMAKVDIGFASIIVITFLVTLLIAYIVYVALNVRKLYRNYRTWKESNWNICILDRSALNENSTNVRNDSNSVEQARDEEDPQQRRENRVTPVQNAWEA